MSFTNVFGGGVVTPADVQYRAFNLTADTTLQWPSSNEDQPDVTARLMDITPDMAGWNLTLPAANQVGNGENVVIRNLGAFSFTVLGDGGATLATVAAGTVKYLYVTDNSTAAGTWAVFTFGTGTSAADASALAGAGLEASASRLIQALTVTMVAAAYTAGVGDRATVIEYTGGVATLALTAAATLGNDWFVYVNNQGTGTLTVNPNAAETIDGAATIALLQGESCMIVCDGANFITVGRGRSVSLTTTAVSINAAGTGTVTLSTAQVAAQVQQYTGILTGNRIYNYGTAPGYWFVTNNTTGAFSVTLRVDGSDTGVAIAQGTSSVYKSDGVNLIAAVSVATGTVTQIDTGTGLTGGPITGTGTISLANTAVVAGGYGAPNGSASITVDAQGRITAASQGTLSVSGGGTGVNTLTSGSLLVGAGSGAVTFIAATPPGSILTVSGSAWAAGSPSAAGAVPAGSVIPYAGTSTPSGWLFCFGQTVSVATYTDLHTAIGYTYGGTSANFTIPDCRGRAAAGRDDMGGVAANRLTLAGSGIPGTTLGASGGTQTHVLTTAQLATHNHSHSHTISVPAGSGGGQAGVAFQTDGGTPGTNSTSTDATNAGSGDPHQNTQPTIVFNFIIKT